MAGTLMGISLVQCYQKLLNVSPLDDKENESKAISNESGQKVLRFRLSIG